MGRASQRSVDPGHYHWNTPAGRGVAAKTHLTFSRHVVYSSAMFTGLLGGLPFWLPAPGGLRRRPVMGNQRLRPATLAVRRAPAYAPASGAFTPALT